MQIKAKVGGNTTSGEFKALAIFFNALAENKESELIPAAIQPATPVAVAVDKAVETTQPAPQVEVEQVQPQPTPTTRRRRTKAEIEADEAAKKPADPEPETASGNGTVVKSGEEADTAIAASETAEVKTESVDTTIDEINDVEAFEKVAEVATTMSGKTYTEAEVQSLAAVIARSKGAQVVKDKIADLGKARIADLDESQLNQLGAFLESQK